MLTKANPKTSEQKEEIQQLTQKALVILPHYNFRDKEYTWVRERLDEAGVRVEVASTHLSEAQGRFGTLVCPDVLISYVEASDYDAYIFIGEEAAAEFIGNVDIRRIIESAHASNRIIAAIGAAVPIIGYSGKLVGKKVTSVETEKKRLEDMGAFYTGKISEQDGQIITANGPYGTREFADAIIKTLEYSSGIVPEGRPYLR